MDKGQCQQVNGYITLYIQNGVIYRYLVGINIGTGHSERQAEAPTKYEYFT